MTRRMTEIKTLIIASAHVEVEQWECLHIAGVSENYFNHFRKTLTGKH
jgi:hypothetical protein